MITPLIYTTADSAYFDAHGNAFRKSAEAQGHEVRIDIIDSPDLTFREPRAFYCYSRWLRLPDLLKEHPAVLVVDIDSIFNKRAEFEPEYDLGLFFRPWVNHLALKVLCAASYWTPKAIPFAEHIKDKIEEGYTEWGNDQALIWKHYLETFGRYNVKHLDLDFLNYHFDRNATIWTAKGPLRKFNQIYLDRKAEWAA